ncbi:MAG: hypothetical protein ACLP8X_00990 [Streptosporangiaceae bacterium]
MIVTINSKNPGIYGCLEASMHKTPAHPIVWHSLIDWQACGIGLAFGGSVVLALGLLSGAPRYAFRMMRSRNTNTWQNVLAAENRADAQVGVFALVIGFGIQAITTVWMVGHAAPPLSTGWSYLIAAGFVVIPAVLVWRVDRKTQWFWVRLWLVKAAHYYNGVRNDKPNAHELVLCGDVIGEGKEKLPDESDEDYLRRVWNVRTSKHSKRKDA